MNKYRAQKTTVDGITFDSKREAKRYSELKLLERLGQISNLELQVVYPLEGRDGPLLTRTGRKMRITVDFRYWDNNLNIEVIEDAKGTPTRDYEVRKAVLAAQGVEIVEV